MTTNNSPYRVISSPSPIRSQSTQIYQNSPIISSNIQNYSPIRTVAAPSIYSAPAYQHTQAPVALRTPSNVVPTYVQP
jgi:hypothetical protein